MSTTREDYGVIATRLRKEIPTFAPENNRDNHAVYQREKKVVLWKIVNIIILKAKVKRQQAIVKKRAIATVIVMTTVTSTIMTAIMSIITTMVTKAITTTITTMV